MKTRFLYLPLALVLALPAVASTGAAPLTKKDKATLSNSVTVLNDLANAPDKGIPQELLAKADCILIFPSVDKGAFIVGGKSGNGIASCRQPNGKMGSLAFYTVGGASVGFQIESRNSSTRLKFERRSIASAREKARAPSATAIATPTSIST